MKPYRIVVVDDEKEPLEFIAETLKIDGHEVSKFWDPREALKAIRESPPDLVLTDVSMPHMDGFAFCANLKSLPSTKDIPVIMVTTRTGKEDTVRGLQCGAVEFVPKDLEHPFDRPVDPDILRAKVSAVLRQFGRARQAPDPLSQETEPARQAPNAGPERWTGWGARAAVAVAACAAAIVGLAVLHGRESRPPAGQEPPAQAKGAEGEQQRRQPGAPGTAEKGSGAVGRRGKLCVLAVGVNRDGLRAPENDAKAIAEKFKTQEGLLYTKVLTQVLIGPDATRGNIMGSREDFFYKSCTGNDAAVIFISGHGIKEDDNYWFITPEADINDPSKGGLGLKWSDLQDDLVRKLDVKKILLLVDTCNAAASTGPSGQYGRFVRQLAKETGKTTLWSSSGVKASAEDRKTGHGLFTQALLEGLGPEADTNGDKVVTVAEFVYFVKDRVPQLARKYNWHQFPLDESQPEDEQIPLYELPRP